MEQVLSGRVGHGRSALHHSRQFVRANPDGNGKKQSFDLDMVSILEKGNIDLDLVLQPNDLIIVPSRLINF